MVGLFATSGALADEIQDRFARHDARSTVTVDHDPWARLLDAFVRSDPDGLNRVDYRRFKAESHRDLQAYLDRLQEVPATRLGRAEQLAFWINLYNARTVDIVLSHYPVASIRDIKITPGLFTVGPWGKKVVNVEGTELSLDDIEHRILRPLWRDPRIHYAVNCASIGCPNLARTAYTGPQSATMLDGAARAYVNHSRGVRVQDGALVVSSIYRWYAADFGGSDAKLLDHFRRYAAAGLVRQLQGITRIGSHEYDWRLNDATAPGN